MTGEIHTCDQMTGEIHTCDEMTGEIHTCDQMTGEIHTCDQMTGAPTYWAAVGQLASSRTEHCSNSHGSLIIIYRIVHI